MRSYAMAAPLGNKYALGNEGGRPLKYDNPVDLHNKVIEYFEWIKGEQAEQEYSYKDQEGELKKGKEKVWVREPENITVTGLCLFLGFSDRSSLIDYEKKEEYSHIIKRAKLVIENRYEHSLSANAPTGAIFALKNMGWDDKQQHDHTTNGKDITPILGMRIVDGNNA